MDAQNKPKSDNMGEASKKIIEAKADTYTIRINAYSNQTMHFYLMQTYKMSIHYYGKNFTYDQIII